MRLLTREGNELPFHFSIFSPTCHYCSAALTAHTGVSVCPHGLKHGCSWSQGLQDSGSCSVLWQVNVLCPQGPGLCCFGFSCLSVPKAKIKQKSKWAGGFGILHSCRQASLSLGVNLSSTPCALSVTREHLGLPFPLCLWESSCWDGNLCWDKSWAAVERGTGVPMCYSPWEMTSCHLEKSPGAVLLHRLCRKALSLPFASIPVLLSWSYSHFSGLPSLRLQGFFCTDL